MLRPIRTCLRKYAIFSGRASRSEYWVFVLFLLVVDFAAGLLDRAVFATTVVETAPGRIDYRASGPTATLFSLAMLPPVIAAGWRRMHDTGRSGLHLLYPLIVIVGITTFMGMMSGFDTIASGDFAAAIESGGTVVLAVAFFVFLMSPLIVLWWLTRPSQDGTNAYGPNPQEVSR